MAASGAVSPWQQVWQFENGSQWGEAACCRMTFINDSSLLWRAPVLRAIVDSTDALHERLSSLTDVILQHIIFEHIASSPAAVSAHSSALQQLLGRTWQGTYISEGTWQGGLHKYGHVAGGPT